MAATEPPTIPFYSGWYHFKCCQSKLKYFENVWSSKSGMCRKQQGKVKLKNGLNNQTGTRWLRLIRVFELTAYEYHEHVWSHQGQGAGSPKSGVGSPGRSVLIPYQKLTSYMYWVIATLRLDLNLEFKGEYWLQNNKAASITLLQICILFQKVEGTPVAQVLVV